MGDERLVRQTGGDDLAAHRVRQGDVGADVESDPDIGPLRRGRPPRIDREQPGAVLQALQQVMEEDRVRLARIRAPQEDAVGLLDLLVRARAAAHPEHRRQTGDAWRVSGAVTAVDVVRAHHDAGELLRGEVHLVRALRTTEQAERLAAVGVARGPQAGGRLLQRFVPRRRTERGAPGCHGRTGA